MAPVFAVSALTFVVNKISLGEKKNAETRLMHTVSPTAKQIQMNVLLLVPNEGRHRIDFAFLSPCASPRNWHSLEFQCWS